MNNKNNNNGDGKIIGETQLRWKYPKAFNSENNTKKMREKTTCSKCSSK